MISQYEGKNYKFKKNSINKMKKKYQLTYQYILQNILKYKKNMKESKNLIHLDDLNTIKTNKLLIKIIESAGKDFEIENNKIYSYNKFNKKIKKKFIKIMKQEKKKHIKINLNSIELYKKIEKKEYKELRQIAFKKPNDFLKAIYLYTICED